MLEIQIIQIGKTKEAYLKEGIGIYHKKLKPYCRLIETTLKEANYKSLPPAQAKAEEGAAILAKMNAKSQNNCFWVALDEHGKEPTSVQLAKNFEKWANQGYSKFGFIIGGAYGLDSSVLQKVNHQMSLSQLTYTHQMVRLFLLEQIYRAYSIVRGEKYHNS